MHNPTCVLENEMCKILLDFEIPVESRFQTSVYLQELKKLLTNLFCSSSKIQKRKKKKGKNQKRKKKKKYLPDSWL